MNTALVLAFVVVSVVLVVWADRLDRSRNDGWHSCGCEWPAEEDGPAIVTCPCGIGYKFRVWRDWRGRQRDAWDETNEGEPDE